MSGSRKRRPVDATTEENEVSGGGVVLFQTQSALVDRTAMRDELLLSWLRVAKAARQQDRLQLRTYTDTAIKSAHKKT